MNVKGIVFFSRKPSLGLILTWLRLKGMDKSSIIKPEMPKWNNVFVAVFDVVFYDVGVIYSLYLFLLFVGAAYFEGIGADCEV